ncbi:MAG: ATP-binding domain-containing protein, partial [Clostridia bacterium]|nr:ATP-binding domain-containing protein [Clostridia bacterium]
INTLMTLSEKCKTKHELINHIRTIFADEQYGICLSTIHKAKGLEADNVYILCRSTMPSKLAQQNWEKQQEQNLIYVAYTRAKHTLGFISEKEIAPCGSADEPMKIINDLMFCENKVCKVLGIEPTVRMSNVDVAKFNIKIATQIEEEKEIKKLEKIKVLEQTDDLLEFLAKKVQKDIDDDFVEYTPDGDFYKIEPPEEYNFFDDDHN